jgi:hypothetical protein
MCALLTLSNGFQEQRHWPQTRPETLAKQDVFALGIACTSQSGQFPVFRAENIAHTGLASQTRFFSLRVIAFMGYARMYRNGEFCGHN